MCSNLFDVKWCHELVRIHSFHFNFFENSNKVEKLGQTFVFVQIDVGPVIKACTEQRFIVKFKTIWSYQMLTLLDQNIASWAEKMRNTEVWFHTSLAPNARHVRPMEPVFWGIWGLTRTTFSFRPNWADLTAEAMKSELNHSSDFVIRIRPNSFKNSNSGFHLQDASETTLNHHDTQKMWGFEFCFDLQFPPVQDCKTRWETEQLYRRCSNLFQNYIYNLGREVKWMKWPSWELFFSDSSFQTEQRTV